MTVHSAANLNALHKEVYAEGIANLIPDGVKLFNKMKLSEAERVGDKYVYPVQVSDEAGFTYGGSNSDDIDLEEGIPAEFKEAHVDGVMLLLRTAISYSAASKMVEKGAKSFAKWSQLLYRSMVNSHAKRREVELFHGRSGLGKIDSVVIGSPTTTAEIVLTTATWAAGIWAGSRKVKLDVYNGSTKVNSNAFIQITKVDSANRKLFVTGNATDLAALAATYDLFYRGAYGKEAHGLHSILTFNGTIFNIDNGVYDLWKGQEVPVGGAASFVKILTGVAKAVDFGLEKDLTLIVNPNTYKDLNSDLGALRMFDSSFKAGNGEMGNENITYYSQNGKIEIMPHIFEKQGFALAVSQDYLKKIGSVDLTFEMPGADGGDATIFRHMDGKAAYEVRCLSEVSPFLEYPSRGVHYSGIVNT